MESSVAESPTFSEEAIDTTVLDLSHLDFLIPAEVTAGYLLGLDTIDISQLHGLQFSWLAGYVGGWWPTFHPMVIAYPNLYKAGRIVSYAVSESEDADWCDCEKGDLTVPQVLAWLPRQFARGHKKPGVYASEDTWVNGGLLSALNHYGENIVRICAWYTFHAAINDSWADCQQFTDRYAGRNLDGNVARTSLFAPGPPVLNQLHYDRFHHGPFHSAKWGALDERLIVEHYDRAREHPDRNKHYLPVLQARLKWLADRVWGVAHHPPGPNGKPTWGLFHRGWRYQQLIHRAHGQQFVKPTT